MFLVTCEGSVVVVAVEEPELPVVGSLCEIPEIIGFLL
jgi:hypothetical protein